MIKPALFILAAAGAFTLASCSSSKPAPSYQAPSQQPAPVYYSK